MTPREKLSKRLNRIERAAIATSAFVAVAIGGSAFAVEQVTHHEGSKIPGVLEIAGCVGAAALLEAKRKIIAKSCFNAMLAYEREEAKPGYLSTHQYLHEAASTTSASFGRNTLGTTQSCVAGIMASSALYESGTMAAFFAVDAGFAMTCAAGFIAAGSHQPARNPVDGAWLDVAAIPKPSRSHD